MFRVLDHCENRRVDRGEDIFSATHTAAHELEQQRRNKAQAQAAGERCAENKWLVGKHWRLRCQNDSHRGYPCASFGHIGFLAELGRARDSVVVLLAAKIDFALHQSQALNFVALGHNLGLLGLKHACAGAGRGYRRAALRTL